MIQDKMPERVVEVKFSEVQRIPTGLAREVKASSTCRLFLEKGCVVVRELVEEGGRKVVKSIALPLNSGLVRTIHLEDEELVPEGIEGDMKNFKRVMTDWRQSGVLQPPAVHHPGGLAPEGSPMRSALVAAAEDSANGLEASTAPPVHPGGLNGSPETLPSSLMSAGATAAEAPAPQELREVVERLKDSGVPALQAVAERVEHRPPSAQQPSRDELPEHVPANAEEAILNRRQRRR